MTLLGHTASALIGAACGAALAVFAGFSFAGWLSPAMYDRLAQDRIEQAIVAALLPYCVLRSKEDDASGVLAELRFGYARHRAGVVANAGWATPLGATKPDSALAEACSKTIAAAW